MLAFGVIYLSQFLPQYGLDYHKYPWKEFLAITSALVVVLTVLDEIQFKSMLAWRVWFAIQFVIPLIILFFICRGTLLNEMPQVGLILTFTATSGAWAAGRALRSWHAERVGEWSSVRVGLAGDARMRMIDQEIKFRKWAYEKVVQLLLGIFVGFVLAILEGKAHFSQIQLYRIGAWAFAVMAVIFAGSHSLFSQINELRSRMWSDR